MAEGAGADRAGGTPSSGPEPSGAAGGWRCCLAGKSLIVIATALLAAGIWLVVLIETRDARERAVARARDDVAGIATALTAHVERTLLGIDQILVELRSQVLARREAVDIAGAIAAAPALRGLAAAVAIADRDGRVVRDNLAMPEAPTSIADREYFQALRHGGDRAVVGRPVTSRLTGRCVITVSRPLLTSEGAFDGAVVIAFAPDYLVRLYAQMPVGREGSVALIGADGVVWARVGPRPVGCAHPTDLRPETRSVLRDGGVHEIKSLIDGIDRIFAMRRVAQAPLWVAVGLGRDEVLASAHREASRLSIFGAALTLGLAVFALLLMRDLQRRRRNENALRAVAHDLAEARGVAEARTQQLIATICQIRDGISIYDAEHRLVLSNEAHRRLMNLPEEIARPGVTAQEVLRFRAIRGDFGACDPEEEERRRFAEIVERARQGMVDERRMQCGSIVELHRTITPDGGFVSLYRDVTDERRTMIELAEARRVAEDAASRKSEMLAIVGHEIRTPMTGILGFLQLLEGTDLTLEQRTYLGIASTSAHALLALLDDLLIHSRSEAGMLELQLADCDVAGILRDAAALFAPVAARRSVALDWQAAPDAPALVRTDPTRIRQIVNNLAANAVKFTHHGEVLLRAETIPRPEGRVAGAEATWIRLTVADRGPGVPDVDKRRIFEPYVQGSRGVGDEPGTGLGLAICRRLVELLGGSIGVADRPGGGAVFWFEIPVLPAVAVPVPEPAPADPPANGPHRVLVVEDDPVNQFLARKFGEQLGHRMEVAESGAEALDRLGRDEFDVVLLDRQLPDADGFDVLRRLRESEGCRRAAVVVVTAGLDEAARLRAVEAGAETLAKPYRLAGLRAAIDRAVRTSRAA